MPKMNVNETVRDAYGQNMEGMTLRKIMVDSLRSAGFAEQQASPEHKRLLGKLAVKIARGGEIIELSDDRWRIVNDAVARATGFTDVVLYVDEAIRKACDIPVDSLPGVVVDPDFPEGEFDEAEAELDA